MSEAMYLLLATVLSVTGMGWLALAMEVHWGQVMHRHAEEAASPRRVMRWGGGTALLLSLMACLSADRPSMAVLVWVMLLAGAAVAIAMTLSWQPRALRWLVPVQHQVHSTTGNH